MFPSANAGREFFEAEDRDPATELVTEAIIRTSAMTAAVDPFALFSRLPLVGLGSFAVQTSIGREDRNLGARSTPGAEVVRATTQVGETNTMIASNTAKAVRKATGTLELSAEDHVPAADVIGQDQKHSHRQQKATA